MATKTYHTLPHHRPSSRNAPPEATGNRAAPSETGRHLAPPPPLAARAPASRRHAPTPRPRLAVRSLVRPPPRPHRGASRAEVIVSLCDTTCMDHIFSAFMSRLRLQEKLMNTEKILAFKMRPPRPLALSLPMVALTWRLPAARHLQLAGVAGSNCYWFNRPAIKNTLCKM